MKSTLPLIIVILTILTILAQNTAADEKETIRALMENHYNALMDGDIDRYIAHFSDDADWENALGRKITDLNELRDFVSRVIVSLHDATYTIEKMDIKLVSPDVAVADVYGLLENQIVGDRTFPSRYLLNSYVVRKENEQWKIVVERIRDRLELGDNN